MRSMGSVDARASVRAVVRSSIGARAFFIESTSRARTHHRFLRACVRVTTRTTTRTTTTRTTPSITTRDERRGRANVRPTARTTARPHDRPRGRGEHTHTHTHGTKDTSNTVDRHRAHYKDAHVRSPSRSDAWKPYPPRAAIFSHARFRVDDVGAIGSDCPTESRFFLYACACVWFSSRSKECVCRQ